MIPREVTEPSRRVFPADDWRLIEADFSQADLPRLESLFSVSNGYLGLRGNLEEGAPAAENGTFVNGFYESWPIVYPEEAYGLAKTGQTIVNVPDGKTVNLYVDDEPFYLPTARLVRYERALDMRTGIVSRHIVWEAPSGKRVAIDSTRMVALEDRHLAVITYEVTVLDAAAPVVISSKLAPPLVPAATAGDPRAARSIGEVLETRERWLDGQRIVLGLMTCSSGMRLGCAADHVIDTRCEHHAVAENHHDDGGKIVVTVDAEPNAPIHVTKYVTYHTSRRAPVAELCGRAERTLDRALRVRRDTLVEGQRQRLDEFWTRADVEIDCDEPRVQQSLRWSLFQVYQASARAETAGVPAKGLTGSAYEGHYFWDTEAYVLPFLIYTSPRIARSLLRFRYSMLDSARARARELGLSGALFPWRTINGQEASPFYAAGTAQFHINADVVYALKKYVEVVGDRDFLSLEGAEILVETARMWASLGFFSGNGEGTRFHLHGVTGPDEYTTVVNDNMFTNAMARLNLRFAAETVRELLTEEPARFERLVEATGLDLEEVGVWEHAADRMYLPYDEERGIHPQDDSFLDREVWDFAETPPKGYPLLLHHHPLEIYRYQVIKQADVVMAMFLLGNEFTREQKRRNFEYYAPLTTGDSSLSACIESIVAAEIGAVDTALDYFRYALSMDLADIAGNAAHGVHVASAGGVWMGAVYGFAGMRNRRGSLSFDPRLPTGWRRLRFPVRVRNRQLSVDVTEDATTYLLSEGDGLTIHHRGQPVDLEPGTPRVLPEAVRASTRDLSTMGAE